MAKTKIKYDWQDRKRVLGLPLSTTRYAISEDRLFLRTGLLNIRDEEVLLYRIRDISMRRSFGQRLLGMGTITVTSSDKSTPTLVIKNIKDPQAVKELLHENVEEMKMRRRVRYGEFITTPSRRAADVDDEPEDDEEYDEED